MPLLTCSVSSSHACIFIRGSVKTGLFLWCVNMIELLYQDNLRIIVEVMAKANQIKLLTDFCYY